MGRYLSNCNGTVGVITRAKSRAAAAALSSSSMAVKKMKKASNKVSDIRNRRRIAVVSDENFRSETVVINSSSSEVVVVVETTVDCTGGNDVSADFPASCCSSNDNASISKNILVDPEVESAETTSSRHINLNNNDEERIESEVKTVESGNLDSPVMRSQGRKSTAQMKMPSDSEIDAFFAAAEKDLQKRFADRYNFDVVKDVALEGRYEWIPIKPLSHINKDDNDDNC